MTSTSGTYTMELKNHYDIDGSRKLIEVTKSVDEWISDVYTVAGRSSVDWPFVADIDTSSGRVEDVRVSIDSRGVSDGIHKYIDSEYLRSPKVNRKR